MKYFLYTTVDITETGLYRGGDELLCNQQQNFDTIVQTIGLCGNVYFQYPPRIITSNKFSDRTWYFEWSMELEDLFKRDNDHIAILKEIFEYVPFIPNLTETAKFDIPMFKVSENIIFDYEKPCGLRLINNTI